MTERPILFSGPMVRALLAGRKTQTRRVVTAKGAQQDGVRYWRPGSQPGRWVACDGFAIGWILCPYGMAGDRLWVRETWLEMTPSDRPRSFDYRADTEDGPARWRPSIFMPREACRIRLEVTDVRIERLNDITPGDACSEGIEFPPDGVPWDPCDAFADLWDQINAKRGFDWETNPWVWVVAFRRVDP